MRNGDWDSVSLVAFIPPPAYTPWATGHFIKSITDASQIPASAVIWGIADSPFSPRIPVFVRYSSGCDVLVKVSTHKG